MTIAVVGFHGRFPGALGVDEFWRNLCAVRESVSFFDPATAIAEGEAEAVARDPSYVPARALAPLCLHFDHDFFEMSAGEAQATDPQHRILLEEAWAALEHAGLGNRSRRERVGVFSSCSMASAGSSALAKREQGDFYEASIGLYPDFLATRISHKLRLGGPSVTVATACSSSLVAIHLACRSIQAGECDVALAGGASFQAPERIGYLYEEEGVFSPDGHCRPFDEAAAGMVSGTGAGVVVLKDYERAIADGHTIWGVVKGSAVNNDGGGKGSFGAPSPEGQVEAIALAQAQAGVDPAEIGFLEGHGTATALGDQVEVAALGSVFAGVETGRVRLGSVKSNIGHLDAAAGVAGFLKALLAAQTGTVPGTANFRTPKTSLELEGSPFKVSGATEPWTERGPRLAAVSSFGIGGTNAHLIIEGGMAAPRRAGSSRSRVLRLSAASPAALAQSRRDLAAALEGDDPPALVDAERTLRAGRHPLRHRAAVAAADPEVAVARLRSDAHEATKVGEPAIAFMFSGQGSQRPGMAEPLWETEPEFRRELEAVLEHLEPNTPHDLYGLLLDHGRPRAETDRTDVAQPALFAFECALARTLESREIRPHALIGHSIGELTAAHIAGYLSLEDACRLVVRRGQLMHELPDGAMAAVLGDAETLGEILSPELEIAALNAPEASVVAGTPSAVRRFQERAEGRSISVTHLKTSKAFHSQLVEPAMAQFAAEAGEMEWRAPQVPVISNVTGEICPPGLLASSEYWAEHMRRPVLFSRGLESLRAGGCTLLVEIGPGRALEQLAQMSLPEVPARACAPLEVEREDLSEVSAWLWAHGLDAQASEAGEGRLVPLPTYPFQRVEMEPTSALAATREDPQGDPAKREVRIHLSRWRRLQPVKLSGDPAPVMVLGDGRGLGEALVGRLTETGSSSTLLSLPEAQEHPETTCDELWWQDRLRAFDGPLRLVHLLSVDAQDEGERLAARQLAFHSVCALSRALDGMASTGPLSLDLVTSNVFDVIGKDGGSPLGALTHGAGLGIRHDLESLDVRILDVSVGEAGVEGCAVELAQWLGRGEGGTLALRRGSAWTREFPVEQGGATAAEPLRSDRCVLITGGTGGIGLALASQLGGTEGPPIVLVSRSGRPDDPRVEHLLEAGVEVMVQRADVTSEAEMAAAMEAARERYGGIQGVIHAAGVAGHALVVNQSVEEAEETLAPKVTGALVLRRLAPRFDLDFLCLCSSLTGIEGARGAAAYAAGNAFLDAVAWADRDGPRLLSLDWDAWRESGMAVDGQGAEGARSAFLANGLSDHEGATMLLRSLALAEPQLLVAAGELSERMDPADEDDGDAPQDGASESREEDVASIWADVLGVAQLEPDVKLDSLGVTSLQAMKVAARVRRTYGIRLPVRAVLRARTPAELEKVVENST